MNARTKSRVWFSLAVCLFILSAFLFLVSLLSYPSFRRPGSGTAPFAQFLVVISLLPVILFSLGMICRNKANESQIHCQQSGGGDSDSRDEDGTPFGAPQR